MARGGARNRSGPQPDPLSGRSERRGLSVSALPNEGFAGPVPRWPLPPAEVYRDVVVDKVRVREFDEDASVARREREAELWVWAWGTPQAAAWARESWRWHAVAMWVRTQAVCESAEATAADKNALHRFADQVGLTPAGLRENGWAVALPVVEQAADDEAPDDEGEPPRRRLSAV